MFLFRQPRSSNLFHKMRRPLSLILAALLVLPLLSACYQSSPSPESTIDVGSAPVGVKITAPQLLQIVNYPNPEGETPPMTVEQITISGSNAGDFSYSPSATLPVTLKVATEVCDRETETCSVTPDSPRLDVTIFCTPGDVGLRTATLTVTAGGGTFDYPLTCTGKSGAPGFNSNPVPGGTIEFGKTGLNQPVNGNLSVFNTGQASVSVSKYSITGPNAADFTLLGPNFPLNLPAKGAAQNITLQCKPSAYGVRSATLTLTTNDPQTPSPSYSLNCKAGQDDPQPADLILSLSVTPDRFVASNLENEIAYTFRVKNIGLGTAKLLRVILPVNVNLKLGYSSFNNKKVWVSDTSNNEIKIELPDLETNEEVTGTIIFRPQTAPVPTPDTKVSTRFSVRYDDPTGAGFVRYSNGVEFTYTVADNLKANNVQLLTPAETGGQVGDKIEFLAKFPAPGEKVTIWLTDANGKSQPVSYVGEWADTKGNYPFAVNTAGLQPGTYTVSIRGNRSEVQGNAKLVLSAPALTPNTKTVKKGDKVTFAARYLLTTEKASAWITGSDGKSSALELEVRDGRYTVTLDSANLAPGTYLVVVKGQTSGLQGTATVTIEAAS